MKNACYLSLRTIKLLAELGDEDCLYLLQPPSIYKFGFVFKTGKVTFGPISWKEEENDEVVRKLRRLNKPTLCETVRAWPILREE